MTTLAGILRGENQRPDNNIIPYYYPRIYPRGYGVNMRIRCWGRAPVFSYFRILAALHGARPRNLSPSPQSYQLPSAQSIQTARSSIPLAHPPLF